MGLLVDSTSLVQPSVTSLATAQTYAGDKTLDDVNFAMESIGLLIDQQPSLADLVGLYTSKPRTLQLETASESVLSSSTASMESNSGSLEANENFAPVVGVKMLMMLGCFMVVSLVVGSL